jgi:hypothetical protein
MSVPTCSPGDPIRPSPTVPPTEKDTAMSQGLQRLLEQTFQRDSAAYAQRGFQRRVGYGNRPAVVHIDLANAWTRPGHPFSWT